MIWRVTIREDASDDLREARDWYDEQRPGLGAEFAASLIDAFEHLEANPERYPIYYRGFRRFLVDRFPYKVFYRVQGESVIVFRILHGARDHTKILR